MKNQDKIYILGAIIVILLLTYLIGCTNVKPGQYTAGAALDTTVQTAPEVEQSEDSSKKDIVVYVPLPDWQHYDLNPSSSHYKEIYGINKFKDEKIVLAFQQVP